jgi:hypothetical protein
MGLRAILTSWLTVVLLSMSSVAPICRAECDFMPGLPACHQAQSARTQMTAMAGMPNHEACCGKPISMSSRTSGCHHEACVGQPALKTDHMGYSAQANGISDQVPSEVLVILPATVETCMLVRGPPLLPKSSPVTLHTTLIV